MSVEAGLKIDLSSYSDDLFEIILLFNKNNWIFKNDEMEYCIPTNDDDFDWQKDKLEYSKLKALISENQNAGRLSFVRLYDTESDAVIEAFGTDTKEVCLSLDYNRRTIEGTRYTDASWYILNTVGRINKEKSIIQHFIFDEFE